MDTRTLALGTALVTLAGLMPTLVCAQAAPAPEAAAKPAPRDEQVGEIIVTATRRNENVLKIPYNISALSGDALTRSGVADLASLRNSVPGLTAADYGDRAGNINNNFIIRGVNTNDIGVGESEFPNLGGATVSNYIDDTPMFANLKLTDIARVEVLRGPQGTLFGADSVGGTIRTIHNKPDPSRFDYFIDASASGTDHADKPNDSVDLMLNLPITDRAALRINGGYDRNAGFINADNAVVYDKNGAFLLLTAQPLLANPADPLNSGFVTTHLHGINSSKTWYLRADGLWKVTDNFSAELSYQHQNDQSNGFSFEAPGADYVTHRRIPLNPADTNTDLGALTLTADFGFGTVTSSSSYYNVGADDMYDNSALDVKYPYYYGSYPRVTTTNYDFNRDSAFTQEVRLVSPKGEHFDYVAGVYYQDRRTQAYSVETVPGLAAWSALDGSGPEGVGAWADWLVSYYGGTRPGSLTPADLTYDFKRDVHFIDVAGFGEATWHITPALRITGGARVFQETFNQTTIQHIYGAGTTFGSDSLGASAGTGAKTSTSEIFKANMSYDLGPHTLTYFTFSQGYRAGGANAYPEGTCNFCDSAALATFGSDKADNFELGVKGLLGGLRYSAALYDIEWSNIQLEVSAVSGTPVIINGGTARSYGAELEGQYKLSPDVTVSGGYSYTDAALTQNFSVDGGAYFGTAGTLLPGVSHHQVNFAIDYTPTVFGDHEVDLHLDGSYRSSFNNQIETSLDNFRHISGYSLFNAYVQTQITPKLQVQLFARNLFNAKGISAASSLESSGGASDPAYLLYHSFEASEFVSRPLTVGLRFVLRH
ncbi:MAG TPA: TonB-dependent receptor [Caulobacteraceae bacterium]|jgi:outer membrane receptor protein involved in Fe transport